MVGIARGGGKQCREMCIKVTQILNLRLESGEPGRELRLGL